MLNDSKRGDARKLVFLEPLAMYEHCRHRVFDNWRSTAAGAIAAACAVTVPMVVTGSADGMDVALAFILAAVGAACKDPGSAK